MLHAHDHERGESQPIVIAPLRQVFRLGEFMKQMSATHPNDSMIPDDLRVRKFPT